MVLVHAWQSPALAVTGSAPMGPGSGAAESEEQAGRFLGEVTDDVRSRTSGVRVLSHLVAGHPAAVLVGESRDARLLVVGARGAGWFDGMRLGSISTACAPRPVPDGHRPPRLNARPVAVRAPHAPSAG